MNIRLAELQDLDTVLNITRTCNLFMKSKGIYQWTEKYPSLSDFKKDFNRKELYVLEEGKSIIGCIVISTFMDEVYKPVKWLITNEANHIYIHRIAVIPEKQGMGFAQQLMSYAEDYAKKNHYISVRLDAFSQNKRNLKFYEIRGYRKLEAINLPEQSEYPFYCFEKVL